MSYWTRRQEQLKQTAEKDEAKLKKRLSSFFDAEFKRLEKEIAAYYQTYGVDNVIEYRRLLESLPDEDRKLLIERMDEFARKYPQYADLMPVRETIYRLNRLEGLQYSVFMEEANIAGYTSEQMTTYLTGLSQKGVNMAMETLGFGKSFYAINAAVVKQFVDAPWCNGENFSTRIWNDTRKLAQYLNQDIAQGFARGDSYDKLVRQLRKRFSNVNRRDAYRLIFTEGTYVMAESSMGLARQVFEIKDRQPGVNFPPIHPWCRCTWEIVVDDWDRWIDDYVAKHSGETKRAETVAKRVDDGIINKKEDMLKIDLQFFAEKDIKNQESRSLKRAIRKYQARIEDHEAKIKNPKEIYPEWDTYDRRYQEGLKRHWNKEIRNFRQSIQDRIDELKERGDYDE